MDNHFVVYLGSLVLLAVIFAGFFLGDLLSNAIGLPHG